jgi:small subunit ribosomal protein S3
MTHRVKPKSFRIKGINDWHSRGFYGKNFKKYLEEDFKIRTFLKEKLGIAEIEKIDIERFATKINVIIHSARPGLIIGRRGERVGLLKKELENLLSEKKELLIEIQPVKNPWASAPLCAQWIAKKIEQRMAFRRVLKQALSKIMSSREVEGARVQVSGRLNGVEMARTEWLKQGKLPRQTIKGNLDYGEAQAFCAYGVIGVKVWIYKGKKEKEE